jgi:hypothetical protein
VFRTPGPCQRHEADPRLRVSLNDSLLFDTNSQRCWRTLQRSIRIYRYNGLHSTVSAFLKGHPAREGSTMCCAARTRDQTYCTVITYTQNTRAVRGPCRVKLGLQVLQYPYGWHLVHPRQSNPQSAERPVLLGLLLPLDRMTYRISSC